MIVTAEQKKSEEMAITEDDVNEIKQEITSFRFELIDILRSNGMNTSKASKRSTEGTGNNHLERQSCVEFLIF